MLSFNKFFNFVGDELGKWAESDVGQVVDTVGLVGVGIAAGILTAGILPAAAAAAGLTAGSLAIAGGALGYEAGTQIASATNAASAAETQAEQEKIKNQTTLDQTATQNDALKVRQDEDLTQLTTNQAADVALLTKQQTENLGSYTNQQDLEEQRQSESERSAYGSANYELRGAQEQLGAQRAAAQGGASTIISNSAKRGLKVGAGAVKSGQDIAKGNITTNPDGSVSYAPSVPNIYDPATSPLLQLAVYERNANRAIAAQGENTVGASNLATGQIASGTRQFIAQQGQNLAAFNLGQAQNMEGLLAQQGQNLSAMKLAHKQGLDSAKLGFNQMQDSIRLDEKFTETNLQTYESSLWLSAFSNIIDTGTSLFSKLYTPKIGSPQAFSPAGYDYFNYDNAMGLSYYTPGVR